MQEEHVDGHTKPDTEEQVDESAPPEDSWANGYNPPLLVGFMASEDVVRSVRRDPDTGEEEQVYSLQRLNYTLRARGWPALFRRVAFTHLWIGGEEAIPYQVNLRILDPEGGEIANSKAIVIGAPESVDPVVISAFFNLWLKGPGVYWAELLLDNALVLRIPITVLGPPAPAETEALSEPSETSEEREVEETTPLEVKSTEESGTPGL